ncbi:MAG: hypothetical protein GY809_30890 [Planctomycetes bacterium]|nr:hypothetical protein [Planctomycetota bacterium]
MGLSRTALDRATYQAIRLKLLKIGAQIRITVRKVWIHLSESYPYQDIFRQVHRNLAHLQKRPLRCQRLFALAHPQSQTNRIIRAQKFWAD